jgi:hypothetical protein
MHMTCGAIAVATIISRWSPCACCVVVLVLLRVHVAASPHCPPPLLLQPALLLITTLAFLRCFGACLDCSTD